MRDFVAFWALLLVISVLAAWAYGGAELAKGTAVIIFLGGFFLACYFIPSWIACGRSHHNSAAIVLLNIFCGWTALGWIAALIWSMTAVNPASHPAPQTPSPAAGQTDQADHPV